MDSPVCGGEGKSHPSGNCRDQSAKSAGGVCGPYEVCFSGRFTIDTPSPGYSAASDSNFDAKVDGADLAMLLGSWGDAPRHDIPPSDCPLNLINP